MLLVLRYRTGAEIATPGGISRNGEALYLKRLTASVVLATLVVGCGGGGGASKQISDSKFDGAFSTAFNATTSVGNCPLFDVAAVSKISYNARHPVSELSFGAEDATSDGTHVSEFGVRFTGCDWNVEGPGGWKVDVSKDVDLGPKLDAYQLVATRQSGKYFVVVTSEDYKDSSDPDLPDKGTGDSIIEAVIAHLS